VDEISKGLAKGGLRNESEARLLLGIAQAQGGPRRDANKSFVTRVKGDPSLERPRQPVEPARETGLNEATGQGDANDGNQGR